MIELTEQQRQELSAAEPVAIDPQTRRECVLVRREVYGRIARSSRRRGRTCAPSASS